MTLRLKLFVLVAGVVVFATSGVTAVAPGTIRTCSTPRSRNVGHRRSMNCAENNTHNLYDYHVPEAKTPDF